MFIVIQFIGFSIIFGYCYGNNDPCVNNTVIKYSTYRGGNCPSKTGKEICDKYEKNQWYITSDKSDIALTNPGPFKCATNHPIWMNDTLPSVADGVVNRTACVDYGRDECEEKLDIKIKNCNGFYAYYLTMPSSCYAAYCFGETKACPPVEPCDFYYHDSLSDTQRTAQCQFGSRSSKCDNSMSGGWLRLYGKGNQETTIPTFCPKRGSCGTTSPIWVNGTYPSLSEGIVKMKACVHTANSCCDKSYNINVKNCTTHLVFNLTNTTSCPEAYCFDDENVHCIEDYSGANSLRSLEITIVTIICLSLTLISEIV